MRWSLSAVMALGALGCGGEDKCDEWPLTPVNVMVEDQMGDPVEGAPVELDGVACVEDGGGLYSCELDQEAPGQLSIVDGRYNAWSQFLEIPDPTCDPAPLQVTASLGVMMGA